MIGRCRRRYGVGFALVVAFGASAAVASPQVSTKYSHYAVEGGTPQELVSYMLRHGPYVDNDHAFAAAESVMAHEASLGGDRLCSVHNYRIKLDVTIRLPRVSNEARLAAPVRQQWRSFYGYARRHEETHRAIWTRCAADIERKVEALPAMPSCEATQERVRAIFREGHAACGRLHDAFDADEQRRLRSAPLVSQAFKPARALAARRTFTAQGTAFSRERQGLVDSANR
jgi:predicted secreted Zn-dependent protease